MRPRSKPKKLSPAKHIAVVLQKRLSSRAVDELALILGVGSSTVYNWHAGRRGLGPDDIVEVAQYLGMSTDQLLGVEPPPKINWIDILEDCTDDEADVRAAVAGIWQALERMRKTHARMRAHVKSS